MNSMAKITARLMATKTAARQLKYPEAGIFRFAFAVRRG